MPSLNDLKYRDNQVITDESGHTVDLGNLERNMSEMVLDPTGERVTNPNLQKYLDNPKLADAEAAIEFIKTQGTRIDGSGPAGEDNRATPETKAKLAKQTEDAVQTIKDYATPPRPQGNFQIPGAGEREAFEQYLIDNQFGGQDPLMLDPRQMVMEKTEEDYANAWEGMYQPRQRPWSALSDQEKQAFISKAQGYFYEQAKTRVEQAQVRRNNMMAQYDKNLKERQLLAKEAEERVNKSIKDQRELAEKVKAQQEKDRQNLLKIQGDLIKAKSDLYQAENPVDTYGQPKKDGANQEEVKSRKEHIKMLEAEVNDLRGRVYEKGPGAAADTTAGKPMTKELVLKYRKEANGDDNLARLNAVKDGYNPALPATTEAKPHRPDNQR